MFSELTTSRFFYGHPVYLLTQKEYFKS